MKRVTRYLHSPPQEASTIERQPAPVPRVTTVGKPTNTDASTRETGQVDRPRDQISPPSPDPLILQTLQYVQTLLCLTAHDG